MQLCVAPRAMARPAAALPEADRGLPVLCCSHASFCLLLSTICFQT